MPLIKYLPEEYRIVYTKIMMQVCISKVINGNKLPENMIIHRNIQKCSHNSFHL